MPFIQAPLAEVKEGEPVPEGTYALRVVSCDERESEKPNVLSVFALGLRVEHTDYPNAQLVRHWLAIPSPEHEYSELMWLGVKRFLHAFGIPFEADGFNTDDLEGATCDACPIGLTEPNDEGVVFNELRLPRLPREESNPPGSSGGRRRRGAA